MDELPTFPAAYWNPEDSTTKVYYLYTDGLWRMDGGGVDPSTIPLEGLKKLGNYKDSYYEEAGIEVSQ
jgi:hypothetical protein